MNVMNERDISVFLEHVLESIKDIESFTKGIEKEELSRNKEKLNAVIRSIEIIGEAMKNIPISFREKYKQIQWRDIIGTRDVMVHNYFGVDFEYIWKIIKKDIPVLKTQIQKIKEEKE